MSYTCQYCFAETSTKDNITFDVSALFAPRPKMLHYHIDCFKAASGISILEFKETYNKFWNEGNIARMFPAQWKEFTGL